MTEYIFLLIAVIAVVQLFRILSAVNEAVYILNLIRHRLTLDAIDRETEKKQRH